MFIFGFYLFRDVYNAAYSAAKSYTNKTRKGKDTTAEIEVNLEDIYNEKTIRHHIKGYNSCEFCSGKGATEFCTCLNCSGTGRVRKITSTILGASKNYVECETCSGSGIQPENNCNYCKGLGATYTESYVDIKLKNKTSFGKERFFFKGKGEYKSGGEPGDLVVVVSIKEHEIFCLESDGDISLEQEVDIYKVIIGGEVIVRTLNGKAKIRITENSSYKTYRMKGKGIGEGDLLVTFIPFIPKKEDLQTRDIAELSQLSNRFKP